MAHLGPLTGPYRHARAFRRILVSPQQRQGPVMKVTGPRCLYIEGIRGNNVQVGSGVAGGTDAISGYLLIALPAAALVAVCIAVVAYLTRRKG